MESKFRPFVSNWKKLSPEFRVLAKGLLYLLRKKGIDSVGEFNALKKRTEFISAVHDGWKEAQKKIAFEIISRLDEITNLKTQANEAHRQKNSSEKMICLRKKSVKEAEIKVLRRFIDAIVWTLLSNEHSTIRRLPLADGNDNLTKKNIIDSMIAADSINDEPTFIAIISDLTTFVHAGDLVIYKMHQGISLAEVKSGEKNIEFSNAVQFSVETKCPHFDEQYTKDFNEKDLKHYKRTKKQWERLTGITETINNETGYDYYHKTKVEIKDRNFIPDFYYESIIRRWYDLKSGKNWSIGVIDECVYVGAYKETNIGFVGFNSWMDGTDFKGNVFNLSDSISYYFSQPFFNLNIPHELIEEIIDGDIIIVLCLDYSKFMAHANKKYPNLLHLAPPPKQKPDPNDYFMVGKEAIFSYENGCSHFLGTGLESRIIFDLQKPGNVIDWIYKSSDIYTSIKQNNRKEKNIIAKNKKDRIKQQKLSRRKSRK